jgi:hypothetical protein
MDLVSTFAQNVRLHFHCASVLITGGRAICTGSGFILSRLDLFGTDAARGAGQVVLVRLCQLLVAMAQRSNS